MRSPFDLTSHAAIYETPTPPWPAWYPLSEWAEVNVPIIRSQAWFKDHWQWSLYFACIYLAAIFIGQKLMSTRNPLELKWMLLCWNLALALFSAVGTYVYLPHMLNMLVSHGYTEMVCGVPQYGMFHILLWSQIFAWSKVLEFGDTAFLVLRKRPVIPLHWIHHSVTCIISFYAQVNVPTVLLQIGTINFGIHSIMYTYYAARAAGIKVPVSWAKWITRAQITQMLINFLSICYAYYVMDWTHVPCNGDPIFVYFGLVIFVLFTILFVRYFVRAYYVRRRSRDHLIKPVVLDKIEKKNYNENLFICSAANPNMITKQIN